MNGTGLAMYAREGREALSRLIFSQRFLPLWVTAGAGWVIFSLFRAGLLLASYGMIRGQTVGAILHCLQVGMLYDSVAVGYGMLPMVLALTLAPNAALAGARFRRAVTYHAAMLLTIVLVVECIGAGFFLHFGERLNWMTLDYLRDWPEVGTFLWNNYPAFLALVFPPTAFWLANRLLSRTFWRGPAPTAPAWSRPILAIVLAGMCVIACRGGVAERPVRLGRADLSYNQALNELALNNFFTLSHATRSWLKDSEDVGSYYHLPTFEQACQVAPGMFRQACDTPLEGRNPLLRRTDTGREAAPYNVVLILMESMSGDPVGALGHSPSQTPNFDGLCRDGLFFDNIRAVGERTCHGVAGVLCGHPDLGGPSVLKHPRAQGNFLTLPGMLRGRGYRSLFLYGGNPDFDNMKGFLLSNDAVDTIIGQDQMPEGAPPGNWGVDDEVLLRHANRTLDGLGDQPFFALILTVSCHEPYDVPTGRCEFLPPISEDNKRLNAYRYADWALGEFFRQARQSSYFRRTIFVLVADHGKHIDRSRIVDVPGYRVPLVIYAPGIVAPGRVSTIGSQTDVPPTVLALLGGSYEHCFMGRNLLTVRADDGFALMDKGDRLAFLRRDLALVVSYSGIPRLFRVGPDSMAPLPPEQCGPDEFERLQLEMLSCYELAREACMQSFHNVPPRRND